MFKEVKGENLPLNLPSMHSNYQSKITFLITELKPLQTSPSPGWVPISTYTRARKYITKT